jgi:hypothetical protein
LGLRTLLGLKTPYARRAPLNVFVLCTGRCGSQTFYAACRHITNYTVHHESRILLTGKARLDYPARHIEIDNRLAWLLGRLDKAYGKQAFYVHLTRDPIKVAESYARRRHFGIAKAYYEGILLGARGADTEVVLRDMVHTVTTNIEHFLRDKPNRMLIRFEDIKTEFPKFWSWIGATGDLDAALPEFDIVYDNKSTAKGSSNCANAARTETLHRRNSHIHPEAVRPLYEAGIRSSICD